MKLRLIFLGSLLSFGMLGYWTHDLPTLDSPTEALPPESTPVLVSEMDRLEGRRSDSLSDGVVKMAISLADRSRYVDAVALLETIPDEDKNFAKANQLQNQWGKAILTLGKAKLKQGKVSEGMAILKSVPQTTESYAEAAKFRRKSL